MGTRDGLRTTISINITLQVKTNVSNICLIQRGELGCNVVASLSKRIRKPNTWIGEALILLVK